MADNQDEKKEAKPFPIDSKYRKPKVVAQPIFNIRNIS